jgi:subtilisin family serine protease
MIAPNINSRENNGQIKSTYNLVARNNNVYEADKHGARVLSCMAAYSSGSFIGTAPDANYHLFITEDVSKETPLEESLWVEAAEKADSLGVDVINTSLGYTTFDNSSYNYSYTDMNGKTSFIARGLEYAFTKGLFCVVAAGNEGNDSWKYITTPADAIHALTVGSVNATKLYSTFSSIGPSADNRVKPDVVAQGQQAFIVNELGNITTANGTSFSSPIVCGLVACLQQAFPNATPIQLLNGIKKSAHLYDNPDFYYGYGVPDFYKVLNESLSNPSITDEFQEFKMYPNPFTSEITIENTSKDPFWVKVYNFQGQSIIAKKVEYGTAVINTTDWQQGLYVISIENKSIKTVNKFVKN